ncbi:MAG: hypothetical protein GY798_04675 [Hyphomicrobiales bacterium]|nr:hypothetical protein [Hyphomicrobiales bacterium]
MSKYEPLRNFLQNSTATELPVTFSEIEGILGFRLPASQNIRAWWSNNADNNVMTKEWLAAGFKTEQVDIEGQKLVFKRVRTEPQSPRDASGLQTTHRVDKSNQDRRHPLIGWLKGMTTIAPGTDLTAPADPDWADIALGPEKTDQQIADELAEQGLNTSDKIRHLATLWQKEGKPDRSRIAKALGTRYQHVRNVLVTPLSRDDTTASSRSEPN